MLILLSPSLEFPARKKAPSPADQGRSSRGTTLFQLPAEPSRPVTGPAVPPYSTSGGRLRDQSSTGLPRRLAPHAGSLKAAQPVFLPFTVFIQRYFTGVSPVCQEQNELLLPVILMENTSGDFTKNTSMPPGIIGTARQVIQGHVKIV